VRKGQGFGRSLSSTSTRVKSGRYIGGKARSEKANAWAGCSEGQTRCPAFTGTLYLSDLAKISSAPVETDPNTSHRSSRAIRGRQVRAFRFEPCEIV
jgi:hypothetical protein